MLTKLTAEQAALLPIVRDEWIAHGLSTDPANRSEAEEAVKEAYRLAGLKEPRLFVWLQSPFAGVIGASIFILMNDKKTEQQVLEAVSDQVEDKVRDQLWHQVRDQVWNQIRDQVGAQVWAQFGAQVWAQVRAQVGDQVRAQVGAQFGDQVWNQVWAQVGAQVWFQIGDQVWAQVGAQVWFKIGDQVWAQFGDQVWNQVWAQVGDQVRAQVRAQVGDQVRDQVWAQVRSQVRDQVWDQVWNQIRGQARNASIEGCQRCRYGSHDAYWVSAYDFFLRCGIKCCSAMSGLIRLSRSCGWWWPFENAVILTERPCELHRDERGRLHHPSRMAIRYPDGWGLHVWHGVRIPTRYYESDVTVKEILSEQNAEVRRALIERYGQDRFMLDCGAKVLDCQPQYGCAETNDLLAIELPNDPDRWMKAIKIHCPSTGAMYMIRVPPTTRTIQEGLAWSYGFEHPEDYRPEVET